MSAPAEKTYCLYTMARLTKQETGLPYDVYIDSLGVERARSRNVPRIKLDVDGDGLPEVAVRLGKTHPQTMARKYAGFAGEATVLQWVRDNYSVLIEHWNKKLSDCEALTALVAKC